jgi:hypothetical protein
MAMRMVQRTLGLKKVFQKLLIQPTCVSVAQPSSFSKTLAPSWLASKSN